MAVSILVVDDDPLICKGLKFNLEQAGYSVVTTTNSRAAMDQIRRHNFQAVLLDIGLPGEDGLSLCRHIKEHYHFPVIFLTARRRELDEIVGLEVGADDYITKPFNIDVLLAHLKAVLRRFSTPAAVQPGLANAVRAGKFEIDPHSHSALKNGVLLNLAPREFDLFLFFLSHPDQVFTTEEIINGVWGAEFIGEPQAVYVQIRSLREKIEDDPSNPCHLITLRGVGYKFVP
jgi:DNA-binding response OmpR family regulator